MSPRIRDIVTDARRQVHGLLADRTSLSDAGVLHVLDQLIVNDASADSGVPAGQVDADLTDDDECEHVGEIRELEQKLRAMEAEREKDTKIIKGLQDKIDKLRERED